jgi:hypothetical protein
MSARPLDSYLGFVAGLRKVVVDVTRAVGSDGVEEGGPRRLPGLTSGDDMNDLAEIQRLLDKGILLVMEHIDWENLEQRDGYFWLASAATELGRVRDIRDKRRWRERSPRRVRVSYARRVYRVIPSRTRPS